MKGETEQKAQATLCSLKWKWNKKFRSEVPQDESQVSFGGLLALGYGSKQILREKSQNVNCAEDTVTNTGSK
jgi:hypothetical protein